MSQMMELIRNNAVPATVMRSAARGALSLPAAEMLQILIHLTGNAVFGQEAALTLARWDHGSALAVLSGSDAPREVIEYFWDEKNRRPALMPALIENPQVGEQRLVELAGRASRELVDLMLASARVKGAPAVLHALLDNPHLTEAEVQHLREELGMGAMAPPDPESEAAHDTWSREHSAEIEAEEGTVFELIGGHEEASEVAGPVAATAASEPVATAIAPHRKSEALPAAVKVSTIVRLARMNVAGRVKQAFLGTKEERAILIRDNARIVQNAVLSSPKLSEPEVETFAAAKNVSENVLREISRNRRFIKVYAVVRNLLNNARCPIDVSLTLVKNLLVTDLKTLQGNKNIPDTLRKVATKLFKEKSAPPGHKVEQ
ncbi:MAG TPA: hypothetical protein VKY85_12190 [Candidatus Angelobacter sp.]|nr:hypothetical protein [Candidatus Angelobacter sp.]